MECLVFKGGIYNETECARKCIEFVPVVVEKIDEVVDDEAIKTCRVIDEQGCTILFQYQYTDTSELEVVVLKEKSCKEPVDILGKDHNNLLTYLF